jgi:leucyl-tRNA synthetase
MSQDFISMLNEISEKWQRKWEESKIFERNPEERQKFYTTAAFPYPNSPFHLGHGRTYTTCDIYARYKRMQGYNVLFPMGFHYTGTPIITMADDVAKGDKELIEIFEKIYEIPSSVIPKLSDPLFMANYFKEEIKKAMKELGLSIDWRREFTTIDPEFSSFIVWQFNKLQSMGYVVKDTHPVGWCPVHNLPVGMHDTKGDVEPEIGQYVLIYFETPFGYLPIATLRPETVFGAVAVWISPKDKYSVVEVDGKRLILSKKASFRLSFQLDLKEVQELTPEELQKVKAVNPITGREVPIIPADFVDPTLATGVVMSVPAHAPFDYYYLKKSKLELPIVLVVKLDNTDAMARDVVEKENPKSDADLKKLTELVYRTEYNKGKMREDVVDLVKPEYREELKEIAGKPVPEARKIITDFVVKKKLGRQVYEIMNKPVYCRCGNEVVVKILKDQWFLDYGNPEWKAKTKKLLSKMRVIPPEVRKDFEYAIDWLEKKACARTRGLGTPLPWDKKWIIESLSDSTIYMAYYTIAHKIKQHKLHASQLTLDFWDYVMLGRGNPEEISKSTGIDKNVIEDMRREFLYWYPLDVRHSGPDLIPNHLSFFLFNHSAIFPEELWPKGIAINGFILYEGKKMSKSLRNILPLRKAIRMYGADVIRIALACSVDLGSDANFTDVGAKAIADALRRFYEIVTANYPGDVVGKPERWLLSKFNNLVKEVTAEMEELDLRGALNKVLYEMTSNVNEYLEMVRAEGREPNGKVMRRIGLEWTKLLSPFAPHLAEEIWHKLGNETFVSLERWPASNEAEIDVKLELEHEFVEQMIGDVRSILNVFKGTPTQVMIFAAGKGEMEKLRKAIEVTSRGGTLKNLMDQLKPSSKEEARTLQKIYQMVISMPETIKRMASYDIDEYQVLKENAKYIEHKLGLNVTVEQFNENVRAKYNKEALPLRPAIVVQ